MSFLLRKHDGLSMDFFIEKKKVFRLTFHRAARCRRFVSLLCSPFGDKIKKRLYRSRTGAFL